MISTKRVNKSNVIQDLIFPIQVIIDPEKLKEYNLKKLNELSKSGSGKLDFKVDGSVWGDGKLLLERPNEEQKACVVSRMKGSARSWEVWDKTW